MNGFSSKMLATTMIIVLLLHYCRARASSDSTMNPASEKIESKSKATSRENGKIFQSLRAQSKRPPTPDYNPGSHIGGMPPPT
ncbi:hypothetical protein FRX31_008219 [Thalictrum thalictroides]|uniref:Transmembrane protein n=1 Tax=Thalictrum thalictroides TaxID=46969 RepID=A0A7J6WYP4_THATH|nr:hypothetical protein FRX31_008219 [Thalictrum thalictroides]